MSSVELAIAELKGAPEEIAREALDFIVFLKARAASKTENEAFPAPSLKGYPPGYFEKTAGSFEGQPLNRPEQPALDPAPRW